MGFFDGYLKIIFSCVIVYLFIVVFIRLFGKKELAQLSVFDLVFILLISNAVQNAMVGTDSSLSGGIVAAGSLFILNAILKYLVYRFPSLGGFVEGHPLLLIYKGVMNSKNMAKARISENEIKEAVREHGVGDVKEVDLAILEVDGNISILTHDFKQKSVKKRKGRKRIMKTSNIF